jgi:hypothetical protein
VTFRNLAVRYDEQVLAYVAADHNRLAGLKHHLVHGFRELRQELGRRAAQQLGGRQKLNPVPLHRKLRLGHGGSKVLQR